MATNHQHAIKTLRVIAHVDMDAFFAQAELLRYPQLRGLPVVIGGSRDNAPQRLDTKDASLSYHFARLKDYAGRGVVTTATYEARAFGVHSAMGMMKAARLAPEAVLLPADFAYYRQLSEQFKTALRHEVLFMEDRGVDEVYLDLTPLLSHEHDPWQAAVTMGKRLKAAVFQATGLTCSIGITPNKLVSKMASELDKPDGLTIIPPETVCQRIWSLSISAIHGLGPKMSQKLHQLGIYSIESLAHTNYELLQQHFGERTAKWLYAVSHGIDDRPIVTVSTPKSLSRETTFERDLHVIEDKFTLRDVLSQLCERLSKDLDRKHYAAKTVSVKVRFADFKTITRDMTIGIPINQTLQIQSVARVLLKKMLSAGEIKPHGIRAKLRLVGVKVGQLMCIDDEAFSKVQQGDFDQISFDQVLLAMRSNEPIPKPILTKTKRGSKKTDADDYQLSLPFDT